MRARRGGFTLIEVMLALGIFGLVAVTLYGTFSRTLRSKALAERRADVMRLGRAAVGRMADEIGSAYYPRERPRHGDLPRAQERHRRRPRSTRWSSPRCRPVRPASTAGPPISA